MFVPHIRIQASGTLGSADPRPEIFSFSLNLGLGGDFDPIAMPTPDTVEDVNNLFVTYFGAPATRISNTSRLTRIKWAMIGADGRYTAPPAEFMVDQVGGSNAALHPPQISMCVTLDGPVAVKRAHGRFYLPTPTGQVEGSSLKGTASDQSDLLVSTTAFLTGVNDALAVGAGPIPDTLRIVIPSQGRIGTPGPSNITVAQVRVGRVFDTQRKRRNALVENYVANPV